MTSIFQLLNPNNTISVNRPLAHAIGLDAAVVYGALIAKYYWYSERGMLDDGWFYSTVPDLEESTALAEKTQKRCVDALVKVGLIRCELRGMPAKRSFYIIDDIELLQQLIADGEAATRKIKPTAAESYERKRKSEQPNENSQRMTEFLAAAFGGTMPAAEKDVVSTQEKPHNNAISPCSAKTAEQAPTNGQSLLRQNGGASSDLSAEQHFIKTKDNKPKGNNPIYPSPSNTTEELENNVNNMIDRTDRGILQKRKKYLAVLKENISYDTLCIENASDQKQIDELLQLMLEVICQSKPTVRINGEELPRELVESVYLSLNDSHIDYVLTALHKNSSEIRNIRAYLLTALYNAPSTIDSFYQAWVNHNMRGEK